MAELNWLMAGVYVGVALALSMSLRAACAKLRPTLRPARVAIRRSQQRRAPTRDL